MFGRACLSTGGSDPLWRGDGKEIFYLSPSGSIMAVQVGPEGGQLKLGSPRVLFRANTAYYDVAQGGEKFLLMWLATRAQGNHISYKLASGVEAMNVSP